MSCSKKNELPEDSQGFLSLAVFFVGVICVVVGIIPFVVDGISFSVRVVGNVFFAVIGLILWGISWCMHRDLKKRRSRPDIPS